MTEDWVSYRGLRNRATNSIKKAKAAYNRKLIERIGNDHKAFWKTLKKIFPGNKKSVSPNIRIQGTLSFDKNLIANSFNSSFTSTAKRLYESLRSSCGVTTSSHNSFPQCAYPPFKFAEVSEEFVCAKLRGQKTGKVVGTDIPARLLIDSATIVAKPLAKILNYSLQHGEVPKDGKQLALSLCLKRERRVTWTTTVLFLYFQLSPKS